MPHRAGLSGTDYLAARSLSNVHPTEQVFDFGRLGYIYGRVKQDWYSVPSALSGDLDPHTPRASARRLDLSLTHGSIRAVFQVTAATSLM